MSSSEIKTKKKQMNVISNLKPKTKKLKLKILGEKVEKGEGEKVEKGEGEDKTGFSLEKEDIGNKCAKTSTVYNNECNTFLLKKEALENEYLEKNPTENDYLYPTLNDPNFNIKIAEKKEFSDTKYDGEILNIKEQAEILNNAEFELAPHQAFVRNFMSFQTPYNSLLLYHGLGSGKTLSSIGVCEEMRLYLKQIGITKRIIIVASPNVQENFRVQLFDERKLKLVDDVWVMKDLIGNNLLKEINPTNMKGLTKEKIITQIKNLINNSYLFIGYIELSNYIDKKQQVKGEYKTEKERKNRMLRNLQNEFNNRLIVIDEIHNIRITDDNDNKRVAEKLLELIKSANNIRLLLLSATPMYNSYQEIIWLLNLININDRRGSIEVKDVFDKNGNWHKNKKGEEVGKKLLIQKATGYISYVRGENPYTFPFRVYPNIFSPENTFLNKALAYPLFQMNGKKINEDDKIKTNNIYLVNIGAYQLLCYKYIIDSLRKKKITITTKKGIIREMPSFENMDGFGYTLLQIPIESLNIVYPIDGLEELIDEIIPIEHFDDSGADADAGVDIMKDRPKIKKIKTQIISDNPVLLLEPKIPGDVKESIIPGDVIELTKKASSEPSVSSYEIAPVLSKSKIVGGETSSLDNSYESSSSSNQAIKIHVHELTGKKGLQRMMDFTDTTSPQEKGSFEYKQTTLGKYGRIFSPSEIGKYSSKIKNICNNIISEDGTVHEGVILIYAQYIDAGIIPIALALEELGFSRFGENVKSLFKTEPTKPVDYRTMKPRVSKKSDFSPAKYVLITGDVRLSPNNAHAINAATSIDNIDGKKIKIIIISQAGAEGVDFKFLRQIHILQPWYNMSRIEQIVGRGVRNFSHKDLPFEKRNVEIFMYGTLLEDNKEESADLYIYRVAEYKAIQIGKVTRVLKETAIDCIINHDQTNFTQDIIAQHNEGIVTQILSNGAEIPDFKVGDTPYSATCDYMEHCNYKCYPNKEITSSDIKEDSYNESFIIMNSEKIIQKIKLLMKDRFFYKKKDLIAYINTPKTYPLVQIYAALTHLIEDTNEVIVDKYERNGYLINIGEYYIFQPSELNNTNISLYDRTVPLDFKHNMINFDINPELDVDITKQVIDKRNIKDLLEPRIDKEQEQEQEQEKEREQTEMGKQSRAKVAENNLIKEIKRDFDLAIRYARTGDKITRGDEDWYKHCGITMKKMIKTGVSERDVLGFLIEHIVDLLLFKEKVELLNYLYNLEVITKNSVEEMMKNYLDSHIIINKRLIGIILYSNNKKKVIVLNNKRWVDAEPEDELDIFRSAAEKFKIPKELRFNNIIGFIDNEKNNKYLIFKTKQIDAKRNTGARCDDAVKGKKIQILNLIVGEETYTKENTKGMVQAELCSLQEFLLRYYNKIQKDSKIWFLNFELAKIYDF